MKLVVVCQYFYPEQFKVNDICFELVSYDVTVLNRPSKSLRLFQGLSMAKRHEILMESGY